MWLIYLIEALNMQKLLVKWKRSDLRIKQMVMNEILREKYSTTSFFIFLFIFLRILKLYRFLYHLLTSRLLSCSLLCFWIFYDRIFLLICQLILDLAAYRLEQLIDISAIFGTCFEKYTISKFRCYTFPLLITDSSLSL